MSKLSKYAVPATAGTLAVIETVNLAAASDLGDAIDDSITTFVPLVVTLILVGVAIGALLHFRSKQ